MSHSNIRTERDEPLMVKDVFAEPWLFLAEQT